MNTRVTASFKLMNERRATVYLPGHRFKFTQARPVGDLGLQPAVTWGQIAP